LTHVASKQAERSEENFLAGKSKGGTGFGASEGERYTSGGRPQIHKFLGEGNFICGRRRSFTEFFNWGKTGIEERHLGTTKTNESKSIVSRRGLRRFAKNP